LAVLLLRSILAVPVLCAILCSSVFAVQRPQVTLNVTDGVSGSITIELYTDKAPITCANFIKYVQSGFYNNLIFHRVIDGFMIQTGGYDQSLVRRTPTYPSIINESSNRISNRRYTVAMARTPSADSASSEFFINDANNTFLNYGYVTYDYQNNPTAVIGYSVFGEVVGGKNIVDSISAVLTQTVGSMQNVPITAIKIQSISVTVQGPVCAEKFAGDVDGDCRVDLNDFAIMAADWLQSNSLAVCAYTIVGDLNYDCTVNFKDVAMLAQNWSVSVNGPPCASVLTGDMNNDCRVNNLDLSLLAAHWLESAQ
jgi:cyclophilin family peptidyl-prolyl cis-trans isomerase